MFEFGYDLVLLVLREFVVVFIGFFVEIFVFNYFGKEDIKDFFILILGLMSCDEFV